MTRRGKRLTDEGLVVMSFGDHLEELRVRIIRAILVTLVGLVIALCFQTRLMEFIAGPHRKAMGRLNSRQETWAGVRQLEEAERSLLACPREAGADALRRHQEAGELLRALPADRVTREQRTLYEHLLRAVDRTGVTGALLSALGESADLCADRMDVPWGGTEEALEAGSAKIGDIRSILASWRGVENNRPPSAEEWRQLERAGRAVTGARDHFLSAKDWKDAKEPLRVLSYTEGFFTHLKVCFMAGLLFGLPWLSLEIWSFVAGGLYPRERTAVYPFIPISLGAFFLGGLFAYHILVPLGLSYLGGYSSPEVVETAFTLGDYVSLIVTLMLSMGIVFQLPLVMVFVTRAGIVAIQDFRRYRKYALLGAVTLGAFLTPPDPVTQLLMAGPLVLLYESGIIASLFFARRRVSAGTASPESSKDSPRKEKVGERS